MTIKFGRPPPRAAPGGKNGLSDNRKDFTGNGQWSDADIQALRMGILIQAIESRGNPRLGSARQRDPNCSIGSAATTWHRSHTRHAVLRKESMRMLYVTCWRLGST
jgi:hypothetical protein